MTSFVQYEYTLLNAGTYTNYGSKPPLVREDEGSLRDTGDVYIHIRNGSDQPEQAFDGSIINAATSGQLRIHAPNTTARGKLYSDVVAIHSASVYPSQIKRVGGEDAVNKFDLFVDLKLIV